MSFVGLVVFTLIITALLWGVANPKMPGNPTLKGFLEVVFIVAIVIAWILWLAGYFFGYHVPALR